MRGPELGKWTQERQLVLQAVLMALWQRDDRHPVILHSDRGCQFTSDEYQRFLKGHNLVCSMSAVGSCADNAPAERFFGVLKRERVIRRCYQTRAEARADVFDYIERFYNPARVRRLAVLEAAKRPLTNLFVQTGSNPRPHWPTRDASFPLKPTMRSCCGSRKTCPHTYRVFA